MCILPKSPKLPEAAPIEAPRGPNEESGVQAALLRRRRAQGLAASIRNSGGPAPLGQTVLMGA